MRPQPNGYLHGVVIVRVPGYEATTLDGLVRGDDLEFQVAYGADSYVFRGRRSGDTLSGTFDGQTSGQHGEWSARAAN